MAIKLYRTPNTVTSPIRLRYRQLIEETLAKLPDDAFEKERRAALLEVSPVRDRREGDGRSWDEKCWRLEVNLALGKTKKELQAKFIVKRDTFWIGVWCDLCDRKGSFEMKTKRCLLCCFLWDRINPVLNQWGKIWRPALAAHPEDAPIAADWLSERGLDEVAELLRKVQA